MLYRALLLVLAHLALSCHLAATAPGPTLPTPAGCRTWPALPLSVALDTDMGDYHSSYAEAMGEWNRALGEEAFRWARPGEAPDVLVVQDGWNPLKPNQVAEAETRCLNGRFVAWVRHNRVLDAVEAYYFGQHELGHVLGVAHNPHPDSVMHPSLRVAGLLDEADGLPVYTIHRADAAAARSLR